MKCKAPLFGFILLMITGCVVYQPQAIDIPLIHEKNECRIDAGVSFLPSVQSTISYGLTNKIVLQGYGNYGNDQKYYLQAAAGVYQQKKDNRVMEIYGGFGYGYGDAYSDAPAGNLVGNYQLYFTQLNYGKIATATSNFETGIGIKLGYLHSALQDRNYYSLSYPGPYDIYYDESILVEPGGFIRMGGENLRFGIKLGGTYIYKFTNQDKYLPYMYFNLGLSLNYRF